MKTKATREIEQELINSCFSSNNKSLAKMYGCLEVRIGFPSKALSKKEEYVDFLTFEKTKQIFRCYEIKTSFSDLKSKASKSFYGNYNYLVISEDLYKEVGNKIYDYVPEFVGLMVYKDKSFYSVRKAKRQNVLPETADILKDSLIRSLFYKAYSAVNKRG